MTCQGVGIEATEELLAALVRELHQVGQGHHGIPRRLGNHLNLEALVPQCVGIGRGKQLVEAELACAFSPNWQRQGFGQQDTAVQHRQVGFFAITEVSAGANGFVGQKSHAVRHRDVP